VQFEKSTQLRGVAIRDGAVGADENKDLHLAWEHGPQLLTVRRKHHYAFGGDTRARWHDIATTTSNTQRRKQGDNRIHVKPTEHASVTNYHVVTAF
jgi:hypothetical protein